MLEFGGAAKMPFSFTADFEKVELPVNLDLFRVVTTFDALILDTTVGFFSLSSDS
jgi:hypothetical protein